MGRYQCQIDEKPHNFETFADLVEFSARHAGTHNHTNLEFADDDTDGLTEDEQVEIQAVTA